RMRLTEEGGAVVDGSLPIGDLALDGLVAPEIEGAETVSGYLIATLGRLAHPGDRVRLGAFDATVEDVRERRVSRVAFHPVPPEDLEAERRPPSALPPRPE